MYYELLSECRVSLIGTLVEKPKLEMDPHGEFVAMFVMKHDDWVGTQYFSVLLTGDMALSLRQYSFLGMRLYVVGDLHGDRIFADEVGIAETPEENLFTDQFILVYMLNNRLGFESCLMIH